MKGKGNAGENRVAGELREDGFLVGSMRETDGGGDLLAIRRDGIGGDLYLPSLIPGAPHDVAIIEVKANRKGGPFSNFRRPDRDAMLEVAGVYAASAWLAYAPPGQPTRWIGAKDWPT